MVFGSLGFCVEMILLNLAFVLRSSSCFCFFCDFVYSTFSRCLFKACIGFLKRLHGGLSMWYGKSSSFPNKID